MIKPVPAILATCACLTLAACDPPGTDPSTYRHASDASTGSLLSAPDTGAHQNGGVGDISIRSNLGAGAPSGG